MTVGVRGVACHSGIGSIAEWEHHLSRVARMSLALEVHLNEKLLALTPVRVSDKSATCACLRPSRAK